MVYEENGKLYGLGSNDAGASVVSLLHILEENPLKEVVKSKYPNIYAAAWSASLIIESELEVRIGEDEVAYLALYIGGAIERLNVGVEVCILCNHGIGISRILTVPPFIVKASGVCLVRKLVEIVRHTGVAPREKKKLYQK